MKKTTPSKRMKNSEARHAKRDAYYREHKTKDPEDKD
jgi:hypothetical protein